MRLVTLNRRGYAGSTPLSEEETAPLDPSITFGLDETTSATTPSNRVISTHYATFLQQRGAELARFLAWFIDNEMIPPRSDDADEASGGISLLGWSLGNVTTLSMLAFASTLDPGLIKKLELYLRKVIIFGESCDKEYEIVLILYSLSDPPYHALGYPTPANSYNPLFDFQISTEERHSKFGAWITSYFVHSPSARDPATPVGDLMKGILAQRETHPSKKPTTINITHDDTGISTGIEVISSGHGDLFSLEEYARPVHKTVCIRALFGDLNETSGPPVLPKVNISYIWCTESVWETVFAMRCLQQDIALPPDYHYSQRSVKFIPLEGGNHFVSNDMLMVN